MDITALQANLASSIVDGCPIDDWERIVADIEIAVNNEECLLDTLSFAVIRDNEGRLTNPNFKTSQTTHRAAFELYQEWLKKSGRKISGFMLQVQKDGRYSVDLNYEKPERLNGVFKSRKADRLANYLQTYR